MTSSRPESTENPRERETSCDVASTSETLDVPGVVTIPLDEIQITYVRSAGPGGQNVNKTATKARIRWKLDSGRLEPEVVARFRALFPSWVTTENEVVISNQEYREAPKNKDACLAKLREALKRAATKPKERIPTKPTRGSIRRRLEAKKRLSATKRERSQRDFE